MNRINVHFNQTSEAMTLVDREEIEKIVEILDLVRKRGGRVYAFGNGGSHATAEHLVNDLIKQCRVKAECIGSGVPTMLAYGNDEGWENMFLGPLTHKVEDGDCVFGISCSGNSANVIKALEFGASRSAFLIGLTGLSNDSEINKLPLDALVRVPVPDIRVQEDLHVVVCHAVVRALQSMD